jgi:hypothetical protein
MRESPNVRSCAGVAGVAADTRRSNISASGILATLEAQSSAIAAFHLFITLFSFLLRLSLKNPAAV